MILNTILAAILGVGKPRASGDDPKRPLKVADVNA